MKTFGHEKKQIEIFLKLDNISKIYNPNEKKTKILGWALCSKIILSGNPFFFHGVGKYSLGGK